MDNTIKQYGVWDFANHCFEDDADLDYNNAMGLALYCVENDDIGTDNFAVVPISKRGNPVWEEMAWCGKFHGYKHLYEHCVELGEIVERTSEEDDLILGDL